MTAVHSALCWSRLRALSSSKYQSWSSNCFTHGKRAITADTGLRLGKYFGTSAQFWLNLQTRYDLDLAEDRVADQVDSIIPLRTP
ncbi:MULTISPECIES: HigA family addiction module antitoxin [Gordonia]|uniref:HigA family addiction module antitoxin n=1 Tax=Gordonia TaxID=2053 RepID=UPI0032665A4F